MAHRPIYMLNYAILPCVVFEPLPRPKKQMNIWFEDQLPAIHFKLHHKVRARHSKNYSAGSLKVNVSIILDNKYIFISQPAMHVCKLITAAERFLKTHTVQEIPLTMVPTYCISPCCLESLAGQSTNCKRVQGIQGCIVSNSIQSRLSRTHRRPGGWCEIVLSIQDSKSAQYGSCQVVQLNQDLVLPASLSLLKKVLGVLVKAKSCTDHKESGREKRKRA